MSWFGQKKEKAAAEPKKPESVKKALPKEKVTEKTAPKSQVKPKAAKKRVSKKEDNLAYKVIIRPLISEKASFLQAQNQYIFEVAKEANKRLIAQAVQDLYGVQVIKVRVINVLGKERRHGKSSGKTSDYQKAYVTLAAGETLQLVEGV